MKKIIITITLLVGVYSFGYCQKKTAKLPSIHLQVFEQARLFGDVSTVISSLNYLIASEPVKYASYADTLAVVYQNTGNYAQCTNIVNLLLRNNPEKESLLAMKAYSLKQLGVATEAADLYGKLFTKTSGYQYGIELMQLQLSLQRFAECLATTKAVSEMTLKAEDKIIVPMSESKETQKISIKAFAYYIEALAHNLNKDKVKAIASIQKAIELDKTFQLATKTLETLNKVETTGTENTKAKE